jgi:Tfp pilus assembly protein PilF
MLGNLFLSQKRADQALTEFEALASKQTKPSTALTFAGMIRESKGDLAGARQQYERVLAVDPRAGIASNNLAWIYANAGEHLETAAQLAETASEVLKTPAALDTLGWVRYKNKQSALAVQALTRSVEQDPRSAVYRYHLGLAHAQAGDVPLAREALRRALELDANFDGAEDARRCDSPDVFPA